MNSLFGKNNIVLTQEEFISKASDFNFVHIDIGTGDGRQVYRFAKDNPNTLYVGIDPVKSNMLEISNKIIKKPAKGGLNNLILVIGAIENIPKELEAAADSLTVLFPWGSLLEGLVKPIPAILQNIVYLAKNSAMFEFILTYSESFESGEIQRRNLPDINLDYFDTTYRAELKHIGLNVENIEVLDNKYIRLFESQWSKRLAYGRKRDFFRIQGHVIK